MANSKQHFARRSWSHEAHLTTQWQVPLFSSSVVFFGENHISEPSSLPFPALMRLQYKNKRQKKKKADICPPEMKTMISTKKQHSFKKKKKDNNKSEKNN